MPLAAFLFAQLYFTLASFLTRVPTALFWFVVVIVFLGAAIGTASIARIARAERMRGRALAWLIAAIVVDLVCLRLFLAMVVPWI